MASCGELLDEVIQAYGFQKCKRLVKWNRDFTIGHQAALTRTLQTLNLHP